MALFGGVLLCIAPIAVPAQSVTFAGAQQTLGSGFSFPAGLAVDGSGNVFAGDLSNRAVKEILAVNGAIPANSPTINTIFTLADDSLFPYGVAADGAGNVLVTESGNHDVYEILAINGTIPANNPTAKILDSGFPFGNPYGVAVDGAGNVFVADFSNSAVYEILAVNGAVPANNPTIVALGSGFGFSSPQSIALDEKGDVFVGDTSNHAVYEILAVNGAIPANSPTINTILTLLDGSLLPTGVAVDEVGNVFVADRGNHEVDEIPSSCVASATNTGCALIVGSRFSYLWGVAVDGKGDVFVTDQASQGIIELQTQSVNFGSANVCPSGQTIPAPCSQTVTLNFNITASGTLGTPQVLTMGAPNLDFTLAFGSTCSGTVTAGSTCAANVTFTPTAPGQRKGAVEIVDGSGNVLATTYIYGTGTGPEAAFPPGKQNIIDTSFGLTGSVAVDLSGNLYVADSQDGVVYKETLSGGSYTKSTVDAGLTAPFGMAIDGIGNLFVTDYAAETLYKETPSGGSYIRSTVADGFLEPFGLVVAGSGTLYVADKGTGAIYEVTLSGSTYTQSTVVTGLSLPVGLAIDGSGSLYVANEGTGDIYKETPSASGFTRSTVVSGFYGGAEGLAVDIIGNVYVADYSAGTIYMETPSNGSYLQSMAVGGLNTPVGVTVDSSGNIYFTGSIAFGARGIVAKVDVQDPPTLNFAATPVDATSSDSPQSVQFQNIGNVALSGSGTLGDVIDFLEVPGPGTVPDCAESIALAPGAVCNVSFSFTPQSAGQLKSTLTLSDNSLNGNPAIQTIQLSGIGVAPQIAAISPNYGAPAALINITGTNFGATQGSVTVGGAPSRVVSWSNTNITIQVPSRATTGNIIVTAGGEASNGAAFTFYPYPAIASISPTSGIVGTPVTITGTGLLDGGGNGVVTFNGTPASIISQSGTSIQVDVPAGATTGPISVRANGDTAKSSAFTVSPSPQITSLIPNYGAPAALIKIAGTDFGASQGNGSVTVGGAPSYVVSWSNTLIAIQVPSRATTGNIVVTADGETSNGAAFTFHPYPAIDGVSPGSGAVGTPVTITGAGLMDAEGHGVVTFNGTPATIFSQSSTSIQVDVPAGASSGPVSVYANGDTVKSSASFTVTAPQIQSISPNYGAPAALITITGIGFGATQGNGYVTINGALCGATAWSGTSITIRVPSNASIGNVVVRVEGEASSGVPFIFYSEPSITSLSVDSGPVGTSVTIHGNNLLDGGNNPTVTFNGTAAAITSDANGSIQVTVPSGATSGRVLVKVNGVTVIAATDFIVSP